MTPPLRLLRLGNPVVRAILGSPVHGLLSRSLVLLEYAGRRTGRRYRIPVMGVATDDGSVVVLAVGPSRKQWWRTFRPRGPATLVVRREPRAVEGRLLMDPVVRRKALRAYLERFPRAAAPLALPEAPTDEQLDDADAAVVVFTPAVGADRAGRLLDDAGLDATLHRGDPGDEDAAPGRVRRRQTGLTAERVASTSRVIWSISA